MFTAILMGVFFDLMKEQLNQNQQQLALYQTSPTQHFLPRFEQIVDRLMQKEKLA